MSKACTSCTVWSGDTVPITLTIVDCNDGSVVDVSSATSQEIIIQGPTDNTRQSLTSTFTTDGTDGKIQASFPAGTVRALGEWVVQGNVTLSSGAFHTSKGCFEVEEPL